MHLDVFRCLKITEITKIESFLMVVALFLYGMPVGLRDTDVETLKVVEENQLGDEFGLT